MQIFKKETNFNIMGKYKLALTLSSILILIALISLFTRGLNLGVDFTGGTIIELGYEQDANLENIRATLSASGFDEAQVQHFGSNKDVLVRVASREGLSSSSISNEIVGLLKDAELRRVEFVGPRVGEELTEDGGLAMLYALVGILIYVMVRFEYRFALGSIAALVHDVILVIGFFALTQIEFDLTVLAAILAVIGYSLNDTIVVFDRIRENFRLVRKKTTMETMNISLNQTLTRTVITSLTTLLVLFSLFFLGGEMIKPFALALIIGIIVGTYSSMYIASTTALALGVSREDLMPIEKEGAESELENMP